MFGKHLVAALRLSPLMQMELAGMAALIVATAIVSIHWYVGADGAPTPASSDWRPPAYVADQPSPPTPAANDVQTLTRPIFSKSRRPPPAASKAPVAKIDKPPEEIVPLTGVTLAGIVKTGRSKLRSKRAFVLSSANPEGKWLVVGDLVDYWTIADIGDAELTLKNGSQSVQLQLYPPIVEGSAPQPAVPDAKASQSTIPVESAPKPPIPPPGE